MSDVTKLLADIEAGDSRGAEQLLPLVYEELRQLAAARMEHERPDHTLQPTALVHQAYLRLVGSPQDIKWNGRGHFFGAAAEAMRRILVENARRRARVKHGGGRAAESVEWSQVPGDQVSDDLLTLNEALDRLAQEDPTSANVVKLRYFAGLTIPETADALGISVSQANTLWSFARAWLRREIAPE